MTVEELKRLRDTEDAPPLLDVRGPAERDIASLGGLLIPVQELAERIDELDDLREEKLVVYCRSGARSAQAVQFLRAHGFDAVNLKGGTLAWSREIDPSMPTY